MYNINPLLTFSPVSFVPSSDTLRTAWCGDKIGSADRKRSAKKKIRPAAVYKGKIVPVFFNIAPCHEGGVGEWKYSSSHS